MVREVAFYLRGGVSEWLMGESPVAGARLATMIRLRPRGSFWSPALAGDISPFVIWAMQLWQYLLERGTYFNTFICFFSFHSHSTHQCCWENH